jgi:galactose mutarotase-like enzyme
MRLLEVNNGKGLMFTVSLDRAGDISRMYYKGTNLVFMGPCGYVSPEYYDDKGLGFLKSMTAGLLTTCGLTAVGSPCTDEGEELPLHGTISNTPAENVSYWVEDNKINIILTVRDARLFGHKLLLTRKYECSLDKNEIILTDTVENVDFEDTPYMILYHMNMGYPLLSENSIITLDYNAIRPRNADAAKGIDTALQMEKPQVGYVEQCFYYDMNKGYAKIFNPDLGFGLSINYNVNELPAFTEWKLMKSGEYVLGLEPGNVYPDGRDIVRKEGKLTILKPGEKATQIIVLKIENS